MPKTFKKLSRVGLGRFAHYHIAYLCDEDRYGACSTDLGHAHQILWQDESPGTPAQSDEYGFEVQPEVPPQPAGWVIVPDPVDGHTHDIEDIVVRPKKSTQSKDDTVRDVHELWKTACEIEKESVEEGEESEDFYRGVQWEDQDKRYLEGISRAAVTINFIQPHADELSGHQRQQRTDIRYLPLEAGDQRVADLLNHVSKHILERCFFEREESAAFEDQFIAGRGVFNLWVDFSVDLRGEIKVERFPWRDVHFGPHEKSDLTDCEYLVKDKMYSKEKLKQLFPRKAKDIEEDFRACVDSPPFITDSRSTHQDRGAAAYDSHSAYTDNWKTFPTTKALVDIARKELRLIECWRRVYQQSSVAVKPDEEWIYNCSGWKSDDVDRIETIPGFLVVKQSIAKMRITKLCGGTVLADEYPADLPADDFFVVPVYAKKRGDRFWGKIHTAKDSQREINKRHSQAIDIGNKMCAYGWFYDDNTFADEKEREKFKNNSSSPGFMSKLNNVSQPPGHTEGVKFPSEIVQLMQIDHQNISGLLSIRAEPEGANDSGAKLLQLQRMKLTGHEHLFDNLSFAKKKIGRLLVSLIQRYYSPQRIVRIVRNKHTQTPVELAGQDLGTFTDEDIETLLETTDLAQYDVVVSESTYTPTVRLGNFLLLSDLAGKGLPIPPDILIELMDIPDEQRQRILKGMAEQAQASQQQEQSKSDTELQKTLVAQGIIPPEVQQRLGLPQQQGQPQMPQPPQPPQGFQNDGQLNGALAG